MESKETVLMGNSVVKRNGIYLTESNATGHLKSHPLQLTYDGGFGEIKEQEMFIGATPLPSPLRSGGSVFFIFDFLSRITVSFSSLFSILCRYWFAFSLFCKYILS